MVYNNGIILKKKFGQHFLRDNRILQNITNTLELDGANVFEIGCGDGMLTHAILQKSVARLWVFEIDPEWTDYVRSKIHDQRLTLYNEDILAVDFERFVPLAPWVLLANLPYQITFPILHRLQKYRHTLREAVIMVQEEVAQKLTQTRGRGYGFPSLFFNHFFELKLLTKIPPTAFFPPPKVTSRLLYLKPRTTIRPIAQEEQFWHFIKLCFKQPRRMLKHNIAQTSYDPSHIPARFISLRAQQMNLDDLLELWDTLHIKGQSDC